MLTELRRAPAAALLAAAITAGGCAGDIDADQLILRVEGSVGVRFSGHYVVTTASGARTQRAIEEQSVPFEVTLAGADLSAIVLRNGERGRLQAEILQNGQAVAFAAARGPLGLISVATP